MASPADMLGLIFPIGDGKERDPFSIGKGKKRPLPQGHESAEALADHLVEYCRGYMTGKGPDHQLQPMVVACCANGDVVPILNEGYHSEDHKDAWVQVCRASFKHWNVKHYGMVNEAWLAEQTFEPGEFDERGYLPEGTVMPSERPDRREVIMISAEDRRGRSYARCLEIERDAGGKVSGLKPIMEEVMRQGRMTGRFTSLLRDMGPETEEDAKPAEPLVHPCETEEAKALHGAILTLLHMLPYLEGLDDKRDAFADRARSYAGRLALNFDRMSSMKPEALANSAEMRDYGETMVEVGDLITETLPYMPEELQAKYRAAASAAAKIHPGNSTAH